MLVDNQIPHSTVGSPLLESLSEEDMWKLAQEVAEGSAEMLDIKDSNDPTYLLLTMFLSDVDKARLRDSGRVLPLGREIGSELSEEGWPLAASIQFLTHEEAETIKEKADKMSRALNH